jgi:2-(1,2-epoxy-1,2-dihydrophenyl)acetyl-CoA isomerase
MIEQNDVLLLEEVDNILTLTLNRPRARNALSFEIWERMAAIFERVERDTPPRALILQGADHFFSAGGDRKVPPARGHGALDKVARLEMAHRVLDRLRALPTVTIAAVEGQAIGLGWSLALACDLVFAARDARFSAPFLSLGLVPDGGCAWALAKRAGRHAAAEILFSGRVVSADEARASGLASRVVAPGTTVSAAVDFAREMGGQGTSAVELTKRLLHMSEGEGLAGSKSIELAYAHICQLSQSAAGEGALP